MRHRKRLGDASTSIPTFTFSPISSQCSSNSLSRVHHISSFWNVPCGPTLDYQRVRLWRRRSYSSVSGGTAICSDWANSSIQPFSASSAISYSAVCRLANPHPQLSSLWHSDWARAYSGFSCSGLHSDMVCAPRMPSLPPRWLNWHHHYLQPSCRCYRSRIRWSLNSSLGSVAAAMILNRSKCLGEGTSSCSDHLSIQQSATNSSSCLRTQASRWCSLASCIWPCFAF